MHGFNRLGGNSLAETVVAGGLVGARVAAFAGGRDPGGSVSLARDAIGAAAARASAWLERKGDGPGVFEIRDAMGDTMMQNVGIFRGGEGLATAVAELRSLLERSDSAVLRSKAPGMNPELTFALRLRRMLRLALTVALGAQARTESRGAHFRTDYPERNDEQWLKRTLVRWHADADEPQLSYEPVGFLDLPPGDRGYGKAVIFRMRQTVQEHNAEVAQRQAEAGRLDTAEPAGERLRWGDWRTADGIAETAR
jgi:fumarate reductase flavoprotein subunit